MARTRQKAPGTFEIAGVAYLKAQGVKNRDIANRMNLSESTRSRLLKLPDGEATKYLRIPPPQFIDDALDPQELLRIRQLQEEDEPAKSLSELLTTVSNGIRVRAHVIGSSGAARNENEFYDRAAVVVWDLLARGASTTATIGVSWGRKIENLLEAAKRRNFGGRFKTEKKLRVIPLTGESLGSTYPTSTSSSSLAHSLRELLTPGVNDHLSLTIVPSFIPGTFRKKK